MIAVDTSALVSILWDEPEAKSLRARLAAEEGAVLSIGNALELQIVLGRAGVGSAWDEVEALLFAYRIVVRPFDARQLALAREAALRFGKGRHPAALNFGDCFAYALAQSEGLPLLCIGSDFARTDLTLA